RELPLAPPEVALAREQTLADQRLQLRDDEALLVVVIVVLQNVLDVRGMRDEERPERSDVEAHDVAEGAERTRVIADRVGTEGRRHPEGCPVARPGGEPVSRARDLAPVWPRLRQLRARRVRHPRPPARRHCTFRAGSRPRVTTGGTRV